MEIELIEIQNSTKIPRVSPSVDRGKVWEGGLVNRENKNQDAGHQLSLSTERRLKNSTKRLVNSAVVF